MQELGRILKIFTLGFGYRLKYRLAIGLNLEKKPVVEMPNKAVRTSANSVVFRKGNVSGCQFVTFRFCFLKIAKFGKKNIFDCFAMLLEGKFCNKPQMADY